MDALIRIADALERIAAAIEGQAQCQKSAAERSEAMQMASMEGTPLYQRYLDLVKK